jgi:restriction system protein
MTIPSKWVLMVPILRALSDGRPHVASEVRDAVASAVGVTDEERKVYLPSGISRRFDNRVGWAIKELRIAGLVTAPTRAVYQITADGSRLLAAPPPSLNRTYLTAHYPAAKAFWDEVVASTSDTSVTTAEDEPSSPTAGVAPDEDPIEVIESAAESLRRELGEQLADQIQKNSPRFFEDLVIDLVVALRYGGSRADAARHLGRTGDGGVDGVVNEDRLGLSQVYLQAKRYARDRNIDVDTVRAFSGSLDERRSDKGILIATCRFTRPAREFAERSQKHIRLIDGTELTQLMIEAGVGVAPDKTYVIKRVDSDYFDESPDL